MRDKLGARLREIAISEEPESMEQALMVAVQNVQALDARVSTAHQAHTRLAAHVLSLSRRIEGGKSEQARATTPDVRAQRTSARVAARMGASKASQPQPSRGAPDHPKAASAPHSNQPFEGNQCHPCGAMAASEDPSTPKPTPSPHPPPPLPAVPSRFPNLLRRRRHAPATRIRRGARHARGPSHPTLARQQRRRHGPSAIQAPTHSPRPPSSHG